MNGVLTVQEARCLTPAEYERYFTAGLCPPPSMEMVGLFRESDQIEICRLREQLDEANETVVEMQQELEQAYVSLGLARQELDKLRASTAAQASESDPAKGPAESPLPRV